MEALISIVAATGLFAMAWTLVRVKRRHEAKRPSRHEPSLGSATTPNRTPRTGNPLRKISSHTELANAAAVPALSRREGESADCDGGPVLASGLHYDAEIVYRDRGDVQTVRRITVQRLHGERDLDTGWIYARYAFAWCHLRQDFRHFAVSRIEALTDPETGEVIEGGVKYVAAWLQAKADLLHESERYPAPALLPVRSSRSADRPYDPNDAEQDAVLADGLGITAAVRHGFDLGPLPPWQTIIVRRLLGDHCNGWPRISRIIAEVPPASGLRLFYHSGLIALAERADGPEIQQAQGWLLWRAGLLEGCPCDQPTGRQSTRRPNPPIAAVVEWPRAPGDLETYDVEIAEIGLAGGVPHTFSGRARRRRSERDRPWTGHRRFVLQGYSPEQPAIVSLRPSDRGNAVPDPARWLAEKTGRR